MCRWITVLASDEVTLSDVVLAPHNSLIQLSKDASFHPGFDEVNNHETNGDGFGVGWYHSNMNHVPGFPNYTTENIKGHENMYASVFRDTAPAWNNANLREICVATRSHCILAHVRAASKFAAVTQENCHPFKVGRLLFCHNGRIGDFPKIRRVVLSRLTDDAFHCVRGTTDSETLMALILTYLEEDGHGKESPKDQDTPFGHNRLVQAIKKTFKFVEKCLKEKALTSFSTLNFSITDGESVVVTRFCDQSPDVMPPSLYYAYGNMDELIGEITSSDPEQFVEKLANNGESDTASESDTDDEPASGDGKPGSATSSVTDDTEPTYDEMPVELLMKESLPGLLYSDVNPSKAAFVIASNPLTKTHSWNAMPRNSIMWCTRGSIPQLRLLREKKSKVPILQEHTIVL